MEDSWPQTPLDSIELSVDKNPGFIHAPGLSEASARKASDLLTFNHNSYHTRFNGGFHNHLVHHLLALWSLGASPAEIQEMYDFNTPYQAPIEKRETEGIKTLDLKVPENFNSCLGKDDCYPDFLNFFKDEIREHGVPGTVRKFVLNKGDKLADDIFCRMYCDLVHPIIHLGCALEYQQPSLVAEALAAACVHDDWCAGVLLPAEEYHPSGSSWSSSSSGSSSGSSSDDATPEPSQPLLSILQDMRSDPVISQAVKGSDPFNKIRDGLLSRISGKELAPYLSRFRVEPTEADIAAKTSEMMHACAYMTGAAQQAGKRATIDFVLLHTVTLAAFYPAMTTTTTTTSRKQQQQQQQQQSWLSRAERARLVEAKARWDCVMYAGCGCPELQPARIARYLPLHPRQSWPQLFARAIRYRDEGHVAKMMRALYALEAVPLPPSSSSFPIDKQDFAKIAHMLVDSVEQAVEPGGPGGHRMPGPVADTIRDQVGQGGDMVVGNMRRWVFYGGLEGAWRFVPDQAGEGGGVAEGGGGGGGSGSGGGVVVV